MSLRAAAAIARRAPSLAARAAPMLRRPERAPMARMARAYSSGYERAARRPNLALAGAVGASAALLFFKSQLEDRAEAFSSQTAPPPPAAGAPAAKPAAPAAQAPAAAAPAAPVDYEAVRKSIADILDAPDYDDGSYGPLFVRLAWHASGTYDKATNTGGSNGATMRFPPESTDGANKGLDLARKLLEPIKAKFPGISYADLWTLAGVVAIEEMGGPKIPWRPGRSDTADPAKVPPNGRLPDASKAQDHVRAVFYRMGFTDQEIVALVGAHALGRCHPDRSGYQGPWTRAPTTFSNLYFVELLNNKWAKKEWSGPMQYEDPSKELMMLPTDMVLAQDPEFRKHVEAYAKNQDLFFQDFAKAFGKLLELGVPFPKTA